ncbi:MAG: DeoR/GlpR family DNA-binding transcription regulator [Chloroflexota bacterium]|nr:DeoR/GlpR family DNA-binding transcription regulator [Chloroflexota bacterium]
MAQPDTNGPMDRQALVPEERRRRIAEVIRERGSVTVSALETEFGVSPMTARRDLAVLEHEGRVRRTHGGAVLPGFAGHEDSFQRRLEEAVEAKQRLAKVAVSLLRSGETVYVDCSTTTYHVVRRIVAERLAVTVLTNSIPVMELLTTADVPGLELIGLGGLLRRISLSFVGPHTVRTVQGHFADKAFVSVKGITPDGFLTDPDPLEAEVKRCFIERSEESVLLVDGSKFEQRGLSAIARVSDIGLLLAADVPDARLSAIATWGVQVRRV